MPRRPTSFAVILLLILLGRTVDSFCRPLYSTAAVPATFFIPSSDSASVFIPTPRRRRNSCGNQWAVLKRRGPIEPPPTYDFGKGGRPLDYLLYKFFRAKLVDQLGGRDTEPDTFEGLITLIRRLNTGFDTKKGTQTASQNILRSLFPSWLPGAFAIMFSKPFPAFSGRMNAKITMLTTFWLMGESEIVDVEIDGGKLGEGQGLLIKRCRYLEAAGCASVCVNTCKIPTSNFFNQDMGLPLTMIPDYESFECKFVFGLTPPPLETDEALQVECFAQCPTAAQPTSKQPNCHQMELP